MTDLFFKNKSKVLYQVTVVNIAMYLQVVCREADTEKVVQTISPIHPETTQAEMYNVRKGNYQIYLEIYVSTNLEISSNLICQCGLNNAVIRIYIWYTSTHCDILAARYLRYIQDRCHNSRAIHFPWPSSHYCKHCWSGGEETTWENHFRSGQQTLQVSSVLFGFL